MRADRRLCVDQSGTRLVEANTPESASLLIAKGREIPAEDVRRLGLVLHEGRVMQASQVPAPAPAAVTPEVAPLADIVHPAGAMPEPTRVMPPESKRSGKKV